MCPPLKAHSEVRPSDKLTDAIIISETGGAKEEGGTFQRVIARKYKGRVVTLRG